MKKGLAFILGALLLMMAFSNCVEKNSSGSSENGEAVARAWQTHAGNPFLNRGQSHFGMDANLIWNDPSVVKEGSLYIMWVSAGFSAYQAKVYRLTSTDGLTWTMTNNGNPVIEASTNPSDFDCFGIETPNVLKVAGIYHMYYTVYRNTTNCTQASGAVSMGHATSTDGLTWTKQGELTSLSSMIGDPTGNQWGWLGRGEPSVIYYNSNFYLYFTDIRCRLSNCSGGLAERGISLAQSNDGHTFSQVGSTPILLQSAHYPQNDGWEGYSTPSAILRTSGRVDLFVDVARNISGQFFQTTISHFSSPNGLNFSIKSYDIVQAGNEAWSNASVRAPTVVEQNNQLWMWYAGDNQDGTVPSPSVITGIGLAIKGN